MSTPLILPIIETQVIEHATELINAFGRQSLKEGDVLLVLADGSKIPMKQKAYEALLNPSAVAPQSEAEAVVPTETPVETSSEQTEESNVI